MDEGDDDAEDTVAGGEDLRYLCRTPSPCTQRSLEKGGSREKKRILKRMAQRYAAASLLRASSEGSIGCSSGFAQPLGRIPLGRSAQLKLPVLPPSIIHDDDGSGVWKLVERRRRRPGDASPGLMTPRSGSGQVRLNRGARGHAGRLGSMWVKRPGGVDRFGKRSPELGKMTVNCGSYNSNSEKIEKANGHAGCFPIRGPTATPRMMGQEADMRSQLPGRIKTTLNPRTRLIANQSGRSPRGLRVVNMANNGGGRGFGDGRGFAPGRGGNGGGYPGRGYGGGAPPGRGGAAGRNGGQNYAGAGPSGTLGQADHHQQDFDAANNAGFGNFHAGTGFGIGGQPRPYNRNFQDQRGGRFDGGNRNYPRNLRDGYANPNHNTPTVNLNEDMLAKVVRQVAEALRQPGALPVGEGAAAPGTSIPRYVPISKPVIAAKAGSSEGEKAVMQPVAQSVALGAENPNIVAGHAGGEGAAAKKAKRNDKSRCYRCDEPGHHGRDCTVEVCDICESKEHQPEVCPLLTAPKPQVIVHGVLNDGLMFYEQPTTETYKPKIDNVRLAMLTVTNGDLYIPQVVSQLQRLVPVDQFHWEVDQVEHNVFKVPFPSKSELDRLAIFGACKVPNSKCEITVVPWVTNIKPMELLPIKWIRVSGIPRKWIGDFLSLWSLGSLFGKTMKVDMKFTRKHGTLRILVGCVDFTLIPSGWTIFIKDGFYRLRFKVEHPVDAGDNEDDAPRSPPPDDDMDEEKDDEGNTENETKKQGSEMETSGNNEMTADEATTSLCNDTHITKKSSDGMQEMTSGLVFSPKVLKQIREAKREWIGLARGTAHVLDSEVDSMVLVSSPVQGYDGRGTQSSEIERNAAPGLATVKRSVLNVDAEAFTPGAGGPSADFANGGMAHEVQRGAAYDGQRVAAQVEGVLTADSEDDFEAGHIPVSGLKAPRTPVFRDMEVVLMESSALSPTTRVHPCGVCKDGLTKELETPSREEMRAFGGLSDVEVRASARLKAQPNADMPLLERAVELANKKNLVYPKGTNSLPTSSFMSFLDSEIKSRADRLGISLGKSKSQIDSSISSIRNTETK